MELPLLSNPTQMSDIFSFRSCEHLRSKAHPAHARYWLGARKERVAEPPNSTEALVLSAKTGLACRRILWVALHLLHVRSRLAGGHICRVADGVPDDVVGQHIQPAAVAVAPLRTGCARCAPARRPPRACPAHGTSSPPAPSAGSPAGTLPGDIGCARPARFVRTGLTCL